MTAAPEGGEWSAARSGRTLPPEKTRYPFYRRLGGLQGRSGPVENLVPTRIRFRTVHLVVSRYTDGATRPTIYQFNSGENEYYKEGHSMNLQHNRNIDEVTYSLASNKSIRQAYHSQFK